MGTEIERTDGTRYRTAWCEPVYGARLSAALEEAERNVGDMNIPIIGPAEATEAYQAIRTFEAGLRERTPDAEITRMLTKLSVVFPDRRLSERELDARFGLYCDELRDIPGDILGRAMRQAIRTLTFFPAVAEIRKLAEPDLIKRRWRLATLRRLVAKHERDYEPPIPESELCRPEDVQQILAEVAAAYPSRRQEGAKDGGKGKGSGRTGTSPGEGRSATG